MKKVSFLTLTACFTLAILAAHSQAAVPQDKPVPVSAGAMVGQISTRVPPVYPAAAKAARVSGTVVLHTIISEAGAVEEVSVIGGPPLLQAAAMNAVRKWTYRPWVINGRRVAVETQVHIVFTARGFEPPRPPVITAESRRAAGSLACDDLRAPANRGDAAAELELGYCFLHGSNNGRFARDLVQAGIWFDKAVADIRPAAEKGAPYAETVLGDLYTQGNGVPRDLGLAADWYSKAAAQNEPDGLASLGFANLLGSGVPKDLDRARELLLKAAQTGNAHWQDFVAQSYERGFGGNFPPDYEKALFWFQKAADQGNTNSMNCIGVRYRDGLGVPVNFAEAAVWFRRAAELNWFAGQENLAHLYLLGQGVPQDFAQAMYWYRKAADQGDRNSEEWVGAFYRDGTGVPVDLVQARAWFQKAAQGGSQNAKNLIADLDVRAAQLQQQVQQQAAQQQAAQQQAAQQQAAEQLAAAQQAQSQEAPQPQEVADQPGQDPAAQQQNSDSVLGAFVNALGQATANADPNGIQNTLNQQIANINAARQQQAPQPANANVNSRNPDCPTAAEVAANPKLTCRAK